MIDLRGIPASISRFSSAGELHNEPATHDVSDTHADYVAVFEFIEKRQGQASDNP